MASAYKLIAAKAATEAIRYAMKNPKVTMGLARAAGRGVKRAAQQVGSNFTKKRLVDPKRKSFKGRSTARYAGKFKKPTKKGKKQSLDKYGYKGAICTREVAGGISDNDIVYLSHSTYDVNQISLAVAQAIGRKLLAKAGITVTNPRDAINTLGGANSANFQMFITLESNTGTTQVGGVGVNTSTTSLWDMVASLVIGSGKTLVNFIQDQMTTEADQILSSIFLTNIDITVAAGVQTTSTNTPVAAKIDFTDEYVSVGVTSNINIQNRTKSDSGDVQSDAVDNQPLKGYVYDFKGVPAVRARGPIGNYGAPYAAINRIRTSEALNLVRGGDIATSPSVQNGPFLEPPAPKVFANCSASAKVVLDPGVCKMSTITSTWGGYFNTLLREKLKNPNEVTSTAMRYGPGKVQMYALEERINTPSVNLITCLYEVQYMVGVMLTTKKQKVLINTYEKRAFSNLAP